MKGKIYKDRCTKDLVHRLKPGNIAFIEHQDVDEVAVDSLLKSRVKAIFNLKQFYTGKFPLYAPFRLIEAGMVLLEEVDPAVFDGVEQGDQVFLYGEEIWKQEKCLGKGAVFTEEIFRKRFQAACGKKEEVWTEFLENTLQHIKNEKEVFLSQIEIPSLNTEIEGKDVVVVARGRGYRKDLEILRDYLREEKPVLIGVDGGGDALLQAGFRPDLVIGDMDSVSNEVLRRAREVVVHTYPDHRFSPGIRRMKELSLSYRTFSLPGTSEDIALLLAFEKGAALIVALGTHFGVTDFLEKGRKGMASTFLVRLRVADRLIDARGVNRLYKRRSLVPVVVVLLFSALIPVLVLTAISPLVQHFLQLIFLRFRYMWLF